MTPAQQEAASKLRHYYDAYGAWVYRTTPDQALERAREYRAEANETPDEKVERRISLLCKSVQFEAISECLRILGDQVPAPPEEERPVLHAEIVEPEIAQVLSFDQFRKTGKKVVLPSETAVDNSPLEIVFTPEGAEPPTDDIPDLSFVDEEMIAGEMEPMEYFSLHDLKHKRMVPRFQIGDPAWIADWDNDIPVGFLPVTITGMEIYPDEILYFVGFFDEDTGQVETNFEMCTDDEIFAEIPEDGQLPLKRKNKPQLSVVRNEAPLETAASNE